MRHHFTGKLTGVVPLILIGCLLTLGFAIHAQQKKDQTPKNFKVGEFSYPDFYEPPNQKTMKSLITLGEAQPLPSGGLLAGKKLRIESYRTNGALELVVEAPECTFDPSNPSQRKAYSPGPLKISSGDGKMRMEGEGFIWNQSKTNSTLYISNKVHTIIEKDVIQSQGNTSATNLVTTNAPSSGTNAPLHVYADHLSFDRQANLIVYTGNIRVEDLQMDLTCDTLTIKAGQRGKVDTIVADRNVVIITKATGGRITGDQAVYSIREDLQMVELMGSPRWEDGLRGATADKFILERPADNSGNVIRAEGKAFLKLPRSSFGSAGVMLGQTSPATNAPVDTNAVVEIYADKLAFKMSPTNGPMQTIMADKDVLILDPSKKSRATGRHAFFSDATGKLELTGNALWEADQRLAKGGILIFDRNETSFTARTNAFMKFPATAFGHVTSAGSSRTNASPGTNHFVEVLSSYYDSKDGLLTFHDNVHVALLEGEEIRGVLNCKTLKVYYTTNAVQQIVAENQVYGHQLPTKNLQGKTIEKELNCDVLTVDVRTNGLLKQIVADRNVLLAQNETGTNNARTVRTTMTSEIMTTLFFPHTNQVDTITAERNVHITQDQNIARGAKAVYTGTNDLLQLTGDPVVKMTNGVMVSDLILIDRKRNKLLTRNYSLLADVKTNKASAKVAAPTEKK